MLLVAVEIMERFLTKGSSDNEQRVVWDPFMGTGTTGVVCGKFGTKFIGSEIDEPCYNSAWSCISQSYLTCGTAGSKFFFVKYQSENLLTCQ